MSGISGARLIHQRGDKQEEYDSLVLSKVLGKNVNYVPDDITQAKIWMRCREDPAFYIFNFVRTRDEHDWKNPTKQFPDKWYLRELLHFIHTNNIAAIAKSRQMMVTWLLCAYATWVARFHSKGLIFIQSKKEVDAANLVFNTDWLTARCSFIELNLPTFLRIRSAHTERRKTGVKAKYGQLYYPNGSMIWGVPQGAHMFRGYTPRLIICDEACFQDKFEDAYTAALPVVKNGGKLVICSTAAYGTYYARVVGETDPEDEA